jgi:hypothetical protein
VKGIIAALLIGAVVGTTGPSEPPTTTTPATETLDEDGLPPRIPYDGEMTQMCEGPDLLWVTPDTPETRRSAERSCLRLDLMISRAPWPEGMSPVPTVEVASS